MPTVRLESLNSIRFLAAVHLFVFHIYAGHQMTRAHPDSPGLTLDVLDHLPPMVARALNRGAYSTPLFFLISGFILTFLYVRPDGSLATDRRTFWWARFTRIYPLHLLVLLMLAPIMTPFFWQSLGPFGTLGSALSSAALVQAWIPPFALSWNFPTWALSTVVFFYLTFPALAERTGKASRPRLVVTAVLASLAGWLPTVAYLSLGFPDVPQGYSFWCELLMRNPLLWLPHFYVGMVIARFHGMSRFDLSWQRQPTSRGWGDLAAIAVLLLLISDHGIPRLLLRHGLLIPLYIPIIYDLARGQGVLHTALSLRGWRVLGQASFSIFMWQLPAMIVAMGVFEFLLPDFPSLWALLILVAGTVLWSVLSAYRFEQPIAKRLRALRAGT